MTRVTVLKDGADDQAATYRAVGGNAQAMGRTAEEQNAMTGLRRWRKIAKWLIIFSCAESIAVTIVSLILFILVAAQGGGAPSPDDQEAVVGTLGICGVVIWAIWDAGRRRHRQPLKRVATVEEEV
jgi:hypothetical protein